MTIQNGMMREILRFGGDGSGGWAEAIRNNGGGSGTSAPTPPSGPRPGQMTPQMASALVQGLFANPGPQQTSLPPGLFGGMIPSGAPPLTGMSAMMQQARMPTQFQKPSVLPGANTATWGPM